MKKTLLTYCMLGLALLSFSCDKEDDETNEVAPAMELSMERTFMYHDNHETKHASYLSKDIVSGFVKDDGKLTVYLSSDADGISFEIAEADLTDGYIGVYTLKSLPNTANGKASTTYSYSKSGTSGSAYFSEANTMNGAIEITNYNDKHNLISGSFELTMKDVSDPTLTAPTTNPRKCDVTVTGTFVNAKLTSNP
jgi:hypothetical protein